MAKEPTIPATQIARLCHLEPMRVDPVEDRHRDPDEAPEPEEQVAPVGPDRASHRKAGRLDFPQCLCRVLRRNIHCRVLYNIE